MSDQRGIPTRPPESGGRNGQNTAANDPAPALFYGLRAGSVPYLNAKPLVDGIEHLLHLDTPKKLASALMDGGLDLALAPVAALFARPSARVIDGIAIGCHGPVRSVILADFDPQSHHKILIADPESRTSNLLARIVTQFFLGQSPIFADAEDAPSDWVGPRVLIGDRALAWHRNNADNRPHLDLGAAWVKNTGLPFVFALWIFAETAPASGGVSDQLRKIASQRAETVSQLAAQAGELASEVRSYLTDNIRYEFGEAEREGLKEFHRLARKLGASPHQQLLLDPI